MQKIKILIVITALTMVCGKVNAQFGRSIERAVQRGAERAVEKKVEQKTEEAVSKALEPAEKEAEKGLNKAADAIEEAQKNQEEADAMVADIPSEIPNVKNTPYTPLDSEMIFFAMKVGSVQEIVSKDAKGKITGQTRNTITSITGDKSAFAINYQSEYLDEKGKPTDKDNPIILNFSVIIANEVVYLDMKQMFGGIQGLDNVQASGNAVKISNNLSVGQSIDDASFKVKIGFINCSAVITEGKCEAIENITVEAGTFNCYKISQKVNVTAIGIKNEGTTYTWYAKGVGAVKSESYDKKGKLTASSELKSNK